MGSIFRMPTYQINNDLSIIKECFKKNKIYVTSINNNTPLKSLIIEQPFGLIVGNESRGVSSDLKVPDDSVFFHIQGAGITESLNVAVATGIILNEFCSIKQ